MLRARCKGRLLRRHVAAGIPSICGLRGLIRVVRDTAMERCAWPVTSYGYLGLNFVGGAGLSAAAALSHQWGFVLLEGIWALVAAWGISARIRG
jgi:hypothetical protein